MSFFPETTAFERYVVKTSDMHNHTGLPKIIHLLRVLRREVTTKGVHQLSTSVANPLLALVAADNL